MPTTRTVRPKRPHRSDVRRALLDSAARVFARHGIDAARLDDVAADAGFTKGAVYSNFESKDALVDALIADRTSGYLELGLAAVEVLGDRGASLPEQARALGDRLSLEPDRQRDWHLLFSELWQRAVRAETPDSTFHQQRDDLRAAITEAIEHHAAASRTTLPMPAAELAVVVMALTNGLAAEQLVTPGVVAPDLLGRVFALLVSGPDHPPST